MKICLSLIFIFVCAQSHAQKINYADTMGRFQQKYVQTHEVVKGTDRKFMKFFPVSLKYRVVAHFQKINDTAGFIMKTSGKESKKYFKYGKLFFSIDDKQLQLTVYQSENLMQDDQYKDYLFVPFTDLTSGEQSYGGGKYLDFVMDDIKNDSLIVDFNKAYNPYCAYTTGYNCPIPPRENDLSVAVKAGEKDFGKKH